MIDAAAAAVPLNSAADERIDPTPEELSVLPPDREAWFTIVVPTRNESESVGPLVRQLAEQLAGLPVEVLFVDDSADDTAAVIRAVARGSGLAVRLLQRPRAEQRGGLGGAVVLGLRNARGTWAVVMDSDLQHPPELVAQMVAVGQARDLDLVAGSRYQTDGSSSGLGGRYRRVVSGLATAVAKAAFPRKLARLSDPMSGFFAVRLAALKLETLDPIGFKILLEIAVRQPRLEIAETPFVFGTRLAGVSKASPREGLRFARHLLRLRLLVLRTQVRRSSSEDTPSRFRRLLAFGLVGLTGLAVNTLVLWMLSGNSAHYHYLLAAVVATEASTTWNFVLTETLVFRGKKPGTLLGRGVRFYLLNHLALLPRLPLLALLVEYVGTGVVTGNLITIVFLFAARFIIADSAIYARPTVSEGPTQPMRITVDLRKNRPAALRSVRTERASGLHVAPTAPAVRSARPASRHLPYRYAVGDVLTIGSQVPLPELEYFRAQWVGSDVDLTVRIGNVGSGGLRSRALMTQYTSPPGVRYQEHLGRVGANFHVEIGDRVEVTCSQSLANSPHVLYTNVIEALLRFITVARGSILLHSACLEVNGIGLLLSAKTDTGKTGTVLRLLREYGALFLSDDMTLLDRNGKATCFPKPLTISHHTLRAVQAGDLSASEWRRLRVQSRLHSKEGRNFGLLLANLNIPIMGINSLTQRIVPPPKFDVDRLVDCRVIRSTTVQELFVIERGAPDLQAVGFDEAIQTLVENTDDAYGFPPFRQMAPSLVIGDDDYAELRRKERRIMESAMSHVRVRALSSANFSWADDIAGLMGVTTSTQESPAPIFDAQQAATTALA